MKKLLTFLFCLVLASSSHFKDKFKGIYEDIKEKVKDKMNPFDEYINKVDPHYKWFDTGVAFPTLSGGMAYMLNVTSQQWLDVSRAYGPGNTSIWTHQVAVIVPPVLKNTSVAMLYLSAGCNEKVKPPKVTESDFEVIDQVATNNGQISVYVNQIPNCPIVYPSDPQRRKRNEDAMLAWAQHEFLLSLDPEWLPRLPMAKAGFQCARAVEEYTKQKGIAQIEGWVVSGGSKRGWTAWMVGAATCPSCPKILGLIPIVPIMPDFSLVMHRQWMSYGGWTNQFNDYIDVNLTQWLDTPQFIDMTKIVDPIFYYDRLARIPKLVIVSSDDEFMQFDWTNIWYNNILGETHLLIAPNSEHSCVTALSEILSTTNNLMASLQAGHTEADRPDFTYTYDNVTGELVVTVKDGFTPTKVLLRYSQTLQNVRRDFRWLQQKAPAPRCEPPFLSTDKDDSSCFVPIYWVGEEIQGKDGVYRAFPPKDQWEGYWVGYYIELLFKADIDSSFEYQFTTPGYAWPNTLPFPDCSESTCLGNLV